MMALNRCLVLLLAVGVMVQAQSQGSAPNDKETPRSKVERKNRAPVSNEILRVKLPKPTEAKLDNGVTVLILEDHRLPTVSAHLVIRGAGGLFDPADKPGIASVTAAMMKEGTTTMSSRQISEAIDDLGATVSFNSSFGSSDAQVIADGLSENFDQWFALTMKLLEGANFPDGELQKLKQRQLAGLRQQRTQSAFLAREMIQRALFGKFPASVVSTTAEALQTIGSDELRQWRDKRYVPQNAILAIAGDVNAKQLIPKLNRAMAAWKRTDFAITALAPPAPLESRKVYLVDRPNSVQTNIVIGELAIDRKDPDYVPLIVMDRILGGGTSGRLFMNLREEKSYTYGAYSQVTAPEYIGSWSASSEVRTAVTEGAMVEFLKELNRMRDEKVSAAELEQTQRSIVAAFALSLEQPSQVLSYAVTRKRFGLADDYWETYPARIAAVTADDVARVAAKYIVPDKLQIVAVGDAAKIKPVMEKYGTVVVYSSDGKPVL